LLRQELPFDVDVLSVNLPRAATPDTPWELTRLSRQRYFVPAAPDRETEDGRAGYRVMDHPERTEVGSDIWCLHAQHRVSVTPISLDLTARADFGALDEQLRT
jgi:5'-nucleotidase